MSLDAFVRAILARLASGGQDEPADGWKTLDTCPSQSEPIWVWGGRVKVPERRQADGEIWRWNQSRGWWHPTHWCRDRVPAPPTTDSEASRG